MLGRQLRVATPAKTGPKEAAWIRSRPDAPPTPPVLDREVSDPSEAAAVRAGWQLVGAYERLTAKAAATVFADELEAWRQYGLDTVQNAAHPPTRSLKQYETDTNRLRFRRVMDLAQPGDRLFDIGFGRGYLAALLLRDCGIARYHGVDIERWHARAAREVLDVNGFADADVRLDYGDLYELQRSQLEASEASFVVCCEVLEHVPDPELALKVLADALPDGADLLFSVPLHGRLEAILGHVTVFDVARLKRMLDGAGLYVHLVEPLGNTWTTVVASRDPGPSARVRAAGRRPPVRVETSLTSQHDYRTVEPATYTLTGAAGAAPVSEATSKGAPGRVDVTVQGSGVLEFPVDGLEALRVSFGMTSALDLEQVRISVFADDTLLGSWSWSVRPDQREPGRRSFGLRPSETTGSVVAGPFKPTSGANRVQVLAQTRRGTTAEFTFRADLLA
ncbi:class I SAM-dependent methyltransferase [Angustibacter sp. McL0619]|uniref:class I SAM-dependent methyltransferase n=1 Tax=Angustibacter sp. McL0619 TaxID=3415676 RepID=UPI003CF0832A